MIAYKIMNNSMFVSSRSIIEMYTVFSECNCSCEENHSISINHRLVSTHARYVSKRYFYYNIYVGRRLDSSICGQVFNLYHNCIIMANMLFTFIVMEIV